MRKIILILFLPIISSGCSRLDWQQPEQTKDHTINYTERYFYEKIQKSLNTKNWSVAISNLQLLESQFPFGKYAEQSQLELMYAQYQSADYESSISSAQRFIQLHPQHPNVDYALYVKGLSELSQSSESLDNYVPIDNSKRDIGVARRALGTLTEFLVKYPNSPYAADAHKRLLNLRNQLARAEINVANFYFSRGLLVAAANRGSYVVQNFQQSPAVPDGLAVMAQAYHMLGMQEPANNAVKVLAANYPEYPYIGKDGRFDFDKPLHTGKDTWLSKITFGLIAKQPYPVFDTRKIYSKSSQGNRT
jgi:outer membrane protein assembly factor BamD